MGLGAQRMATEAATIERLANGQPCLVDPVLAVVMVPPLPVTSDTSELFLAYSFNSPRARYETYLFASGVGGWDQLPDVNNGDRLVWDSQSISYEIMGIERWARQSVSPFDGQSYLHVLIEQVTIND